MGSSYWWILDILVLLVVGYVLLSNAKRGFTKVLVLSIGYIVATLGASLVAGLGAESVYESIAERSNLSAIENVNEHMKWSKVFAEAINAGKYGFVCTEKDVDIVLRSDRRFYFDEILNDYVNQKTENAAKNRELFTEQLRDAFIKAYSEELNKWLPRYVKVNFKNKIAEDPSIMNQIVDAANNRKRSARENAEVIEKIFSKEPTVEVLRIFIYLVVLSVLMVIAAIISAVLQNTLFFNLTRVKERLFGGILGGLEAVTMLVLLTMLVKLIVMLGGGEFLFFSEKTIDRSILFRFLYQHFDILL